MIRKRFYFSGRVQGVGFRYTAKMIADHYGITGFVKNLPDGRVLMEAQGDEKTIDIVVGSIDNRDSYIRIEGIESEIIPVKEEERVFDYRF